MKCVAHSVVYILHSMYLCMYVVQLAFVIGVELPLYYGFYTQTVNNICVMYSLHNMRAVTVGALASVPWVPGTHEFEYLVRY